MRTATKPPATTVMVVRELLGDGSEVFDVKLTDHYSAERTAVFHATTEEQANRLAQAINDCCGWAIE